MRYTGLLLAAFFVGASSSVLADDIFATDSKGMVKALTAEPQKKAIRTRSANLRGLQRIQTEAGEARIMDLPPVAASVNLKIEFDVNSYSIRPSSQYLMDELGRALSNPSLSGSTFMLGGHTDSDGDNMYNLNLSLKRAATVKDYLIQRYNVPADRLKVVGYGETTPIESNSSSYGKQKNRRVEVLKLQ